jgi:SAM-dependent methyltransferase
MLAPRELPEAFSKWNRENRAPFGSDWWVKFLQSKRLGMFSRKYAPGWFAWKHRTRLPSWVIRSIGPFGFQLNGATRSYEYPWAYFATPLGSGDIRAVDIGSGTSGFQFTLASAGVQVTSVDPLINPSESIDWRFSLEDFDRINRAFGGKVTFVGDFLEAANLETGSRDRVYAISVLEHIPREPLIKLMPEIARILKSGGYFIATIDLFLDCYPFTNKEANQWGRNISVKDLLEASGLQLILGMPSELYGFAEFSPQAVISGMDNYLVANNIMSQCIVMQKK